MNTVSSTPHNRTDVALFRKFESDLLSREEAAAYLGVAVQTLAIWKSTKRYGLPFVKIGGWSNIDYAAFGIVCTIPSEKLRRVSFWMAHLVNMCNCVYSA